MIVAKHSLARGFRMAVVSRAGPALVEWIHLDSIAPDFDEPCRAVIAFAGGYAFVTDIVPMDRALNGAFCRSGSLEQAIDADGGVWRFARRHIGSAIHLIGRVVENEVKP